MRKYIMTGLLILGAGYSVAGSAGIPQIPIPPPPAPTINPPASGAGNFTLSSTVGSNTNAGGRGPESLASSLHKIFFGGPDLHFNLDGLLVDESEKPFTGTTATGEVYKDGKKQ